MGPTGSGPEQTVAANFAGNQMRLACGVNKCHAELLVSVATHVLGVEDKGKENTPVTSSTLINSPTPADATIATIEGANSESQGNVTVRLPNGSAWHVQVELLEDGSGNVRLIGTAVPASGVPACLLGYVCS